MDKTPLEKSIAIAGGQSAMARLLSTDQRPIKQGHVWKWLQVNKAPGEFVLDIEKATGVSRHDLRADIFGPAPSKTEAA